MYLNNDTRNSRIASKMQKNRELFIDNMMLSASLYGDFGLVVISVLDINMTFEFL